MMVGSVLKSSFVASAKFSVIPSADKVVASVVWLGVVA